jgi:hypothetical protein
MLDFRHTVPIAGIALLNVLTLSCSSKPSGPTPGTPAFFWAAAMEAYRNGDYLKAYDHLGNVVRKQNEYSARGHIGLIALSSGISHGLMSMTSTLEGGLRISRDAAPTFRKQIAALRNATNAPALQFAESVHDFLKTNKEDSVKLSLPWPPVQPAEPPLLAKTTKGMALQPAELEVVRRVMVQRGVVEATARMVGAAGDTAKAKAVFDQPEATVPRAVFLLAVAESLHSISELYSPKQLDYPNRTRILLSEAVSAIDAVPPTAQGKKLKAKIEAVLKKLRPT